MKKYICVCQHQNSALCTYDEAIVWAQNVLINGQKHPVYITEVIETVEREKPDVCVKAFHASVPMPKANVNGGATEERKPLSS